jgi:serine acetyltransferase
MDDRSYLAEALFDRLRADGVTHRVLQHVEGNVELAVPHAVLADMPRTMARFSQELDLRLIQLLQPEARAWRFVLAWSDDLGRPRYIAVSVCSAWCRGARRFLDSFELLRGAPETLFIHGVLDAVERLKLPAEREARLSGFWHDEPRACADIAARFWRRPGEVRLITQAARLGDWANVRAALPALRKALRQAIRPRLDTALAYAAAAADGAFHREGVVIAFVGAEGCGREAVMDAVARDLAPAFGSGLATVAQGPSESHVGVDLRVVFDDAQYAAEFEDTIAVDSSRPLLANVAHVERVVLRWLECRVQRRYPRALVGDNPRAAQVLQFACRARVPLFSDLVRIVLNCDVQCPIRSPILMPHPFGIVIERGTVIGSRVTLMQQVTLGRKSAAEPGLPVIEDNVCIGPGARVLGPVRIGRGATIGANAVVTRDVPSHCTVVGANRILGQESEGDSVGQKRHTGSETVVNT